ncbi:MAG: class I SAM-dependent methyltransferase [Bacteroidota bacterium]|nr:class I SAM-dependent methyltransferase [Bacteroidota bacterium]
MVKSPLTGKEAIIEKEIDPAEIEEGYKNNFCIEVNYLIKGKNIQLYNCIDSGFRFFYPPDISGDGKFYAALQKFDWYYIPWKWEHEICKSFILKNYKVLEVGCAKGDFLKRIIEEVNVEAIGLELNKEAILEGKKNNITILDETVQEHATKHKEEYDVVCSFQVLEHISEVKSFIQAQVDCLKEKGKLIISVPNNDSFINLDYNLLNLPPHHMGLWNPDSIKSLENIFNIKLMKIYVEPLQEIHFQWYYYNHIKKLHSKNIFFGKLIEKLTKPFYKRFLSIIKNFIKGHTILAVFEK